MFIEKKITNFFLTLKSFFINHHSSTKKNYTEDILIIIFSFICFSSRNINNAMIIDRIS